MSVELRAVKPMKAYGDELPDDDGWSFEIKWDGYRCIAHCTNDGVELRSGANLPFRFPQIAAELSVFTGLVLDGEVVVMDEEGGKFQSLGNGNPRASLVVFDVLEVEGVDVTARPWSERRAIIERVMELLGDVRHVALSPKFDNGAALLRYVQNNGIEGVMAKRVDAPYREGVRDGNSWRKIKVRHEQEFVVAGWTPGGGKMEGSLGSLVLGYYDDAGELVSCGSVGTGWSHAHAAELLAELETLERRPHPGGAWPNGTAVFCAPEMVVQVEYQRLTNDGCLWHPSYKGKRVDKAPTDCKLETT